MIISKYAANEMLAATITSAALFDDVSIGLFTNDPGSSTETVLADLTAATFDDYLAKANQSPLATIGVANHGERYCTYDDQVFVVGADLAEPQQIRGWYIFASTNLLAYQVLETPILVDRPGQVLYVRPEIGLNTNSQMTGDIDSP